MARKKYVEEFAEFSTRSPLNLAVVAIIGLALFFILGPIAIDAAISMFTDFGYWGLALIIAGIFTINVKNAFPFAAIMGAAMWLKWMIPQLIAMKAAIEWWASIPIVGWVAAPIASITLGAINVIPWLLQLGISVGVSFIMVWMLSFIKEQVVKVIR